MLALTAWALLVFTACRQAEMSDDDPRLLARVGDARLTADDLVKVVPRSLQPDDSAAVAAAYIKGWVDGQLFSQIGVKNIPDLQEIDRMTREYRTRLIGIEYLRLMYAQRGDELFPEDSIRAYYEAHPAEFQLQRPIVKGVYIKIPDRSEALSRVKRIYQSNRDTDIDRLEKEDLRGVIHYDYFRDRWVDWDQIETRIPYRFGRPDDFVATHKSLEFSDSAYTHLLQITEYMRTGATAPYEYSRPTIQGILREKSRLEYEARLRLELLSRGLEDGDIVINVKL